MKLLAIETSEAACSAALWLDGETSEIFDVVPRRHSELLLPMIDRLLAQAGIGKQELDGVAFGRGPGSFTGVRIATGVAQGLGFALDCPLVPVSTLAALAQGAYRRNGTVQSAVAMDARMQEVYWGLYRFDPASGVVWLVGEEACCSPTAVSLENAGWQGCGSGWASYRDDLEAACGAGLTGVDPEMDCHALDVATLGAVLFREQGGVSPERALPVYLRNQVASRPS